MSIKSSEINDIVKKQERFSGIVLITKGDEVIFSKSYGYAEKSNLIKNTIDTRFQMASGCKVFTAVAICQLLERKLISFDSKITKYIGDIFPYFGDRITIRQLLTHCSGMPDYFDEDEMDDYEVLWKEVPMYNMRETKDVLNLFKDKNMMFEPGEKFKYNNAAFIVLGLIIEAVTKTKFSEYVQQNIFDLCRMSDSGYYEMDKLPNKTAYGYIYDDEKDIWRTNIYSMEVKGGPAGGAYTTAHDLVKFWDSLYQYKLLSKNLTQELLSPQIQVDDYRYYGLGIWLLKKSENKFKHYIVGEDPGVAMMSIANSENGNKIIILGNSEYGVWEISTELERMF